MTRKQSFLDLYGNARCHPPLQERIDQAKNAGRGQDPSGKIQEKASRKER